MTCFPDPIGCYIWWVSLFDKTKQQIGIEVHIIYNFGKLVMTFNNDGQLIKYFDHEDNSTTMTAGLFAINGKLIK